MSEFFKSLMDEVSDAFKAEPKAQPVVEKGPSWDQGFTSKQSHQGSMSAVVAEIPEIAQGKVELWPLYTYASVLHSTPVFLEGQQAIVRQVTGRKPETLGVATKRYTPMQDRDLAQAFTALEDAGKLSWAQAGVFGAKTYMQARLWSGDVGGQQVDRKLTVINGHDGKTGIAAGACDTVIVCRNTLAHAYQETGRSLRHRGSVEELLTRYLERFEDALASDWAQHLEVYRAMRTKTQTEDEFRSYITELYGTLDDEADKLEVSERVYNRLYQSYETAPGAVPGTVWGAYQAVTYDLSHGIGRTDNDDKRLLDQLAGGQVNRASKAYNLAMRAL